MEENKMPFNYEAFFQLAEREGKGTIGLHVDLGTLVRQDSEEFEVCPITMHKLEAWEVTAYRLRDGRLTEAEIPTFHESITFVDEVAPTVEDVDILYRFAKLRGYDDLEFYSPLKDIDSED